MLAAVKTYILKHGLIRPGERICVTVSGGADSVALLRVLMELRRDLGCVLSVAHFNHGIRGQEADADQQFVVELARAKGLEMFVGSGDAPAAALESGESLETAARRLRYAFFGQLISTGKTDKIALAHNQNDQAETVLMRFLRGAGTRGLAGIYPAVQLGNGTVIRPLLETGRSQIEDYLRSLNQSWREDLSNRDLAHARNKVRHGLLPILRDFNPAIIENLARSAEVARAEEEYWRSEASRLLPMVLLPGKAVRGGGRAVTTGTSMQGSGLDIQALHRQPLALQRRIILATAESLGIDIDSSHVESVLSVAGSAIKSYELPGGWRVQRTLRELRFEPTAAKAGAAEYDFPIPVPGKVSIPQLNLLVHLHLMPEAKVDAAYNRPALNKTSETVILAEEGGRLAPVAPAAGLRVRNWQEGDRFRQAHSGAEKKVKDLLQDLKVPQRARIGWPVVVANGKVIWVRGTRPVPLWFADQAGLQRLVIEAEES